MNKCRNHTIVAHLAGVLASVLEAGAQKYLIDWLQVGSVAV